MIKKFQMNSHEFFFLSNIFGLYSCYFDLMISEAIVQGLETSKICICTTERIHEICLTESSQLIYIYELSN